MSLSASSNPVTPLIYAVDQVPAARGRLTFQFSFPEYYTFGALAHVIVLLLIRSIPA